MSFWKNDGRALGVLFRSPDSAVRGAGVQSSAWFFAIWVLCWCIMFFKTNN